MPTLADVTPIARSFLASRAAVTALVAGRVHAGRLPASPTFPCVLITALVEQSVSRTTVDRTSDATLQVEAFGRHLEDEAHARLIAATCHAELRDLDMHAHNAGRVSAILPDVGLQPLPPDEHQRARYQFTVRLIAYRP